MDKDIAEFAINYLQKKGCTYAEARLEESEGEGYIVKNGQPEISAFDSETGLGVRYIFKRTLGFLDLNTLTKDKIQALIDKSLKLTTNAVKITEKTKLSEERAYKDKDIVKSKVKFQDIDPKEKLDLLMQIQREVESAKINMPYSYFSLATSLSKKYFVNTEGSKIYSEVPRNGIFSLYTIQYEQKTIQRMCNYGTSGGYDTLLKKKIPDIIKEESIQLNKNLQFGKRISPGTYDVVVAPEVTGIISHESTGHPYEADRILGREAAQAGESFVTKKMLGTRMGSEAVTLVDDPTLSNSFGYYKYDDEGVKAKRKFLMKKGVINEFLHNRETAAEFNTKSNGSARVTSYDKEPMVRMSNTFILPGDYKEEELFEGVEKGIYIKNFMEWNIDDKRYQQKYTGSEAYLIENGRVTEPVIAPSLEITTPALYQSIDAVGKNLDFVAGTCGKGEPMQALPVLFGGPSIRLRKIRII